MIVEDNIELCAAYRDLLESLGHEVDVSFTGTDAMDRLMKGRFDPDVVILDMQLPGHSGVVILGLIRRLPRLSHTKVVVSSGYPDLARQALDQWGADRFLPKPVSLMELKHVITEYSQG
jgi:CheY-like chemotaxis protein